MDWNDEDEAVVTQLALDRLTVDGLRVIVLGDRHALVESRSRPRQHHAVSFEFNDATGKEEWVCVCESYTFRHDCAHVRAIDRWNANLASVEFTTEDPE